MSTPIYTRIWLSGFLSDDIRPKALAAIEEIGGDFEFEDDGVPDEDGMVCFDCKDVDPEACLTTLAGLGISFWAEIDSRMESDGDRFLYVAHANRFARVHDNGEGEPCVTLKWKRLPKALGYSAEIPTKELRIAERYLRLKHAAIVAN